MGQCLECNSRIKYIYDGRNKGALRKHLKVLHKAIFHELCRREKAHNAVFRFRKSGKNLKMLTAENVHFKHFCSHFDSFSEIVKVKNFLI